MKKLIIYLITLTTLVFADVNYGVTIGGGVGIGIPFTDSYDYSLDPEYIATIRPALILGDDQVFTIGLDYTFRQQNYTIGEDAQRIVTKTDYGIFDNKPYTYSYTEYYTEYKTYHSYSHNIGISMGMNLNRNPVWWSIGYDTYSKGAYFQSTIGLLAGPRESNNGILFALNTYVSGKKISAGITVNLHWFGDSYTRDDGYEKGGAIAGVSTSIVMLAVLATAAGAGGGDDNEGNGNVEINNGTCSIYGCLCNDGTISYAKHRQGACSWHGGLYK